MKELLDLLDEGVTSLMEEVRTLRRENNQLRQDMAELTGPLTEENAALHKALAEEQNTRETAVQRIDALLQRLTDRIPE